MIENRGIFILASALLGIGFACINIFHISNVFEFQTGYSDLSKVEKQILLAKNQYFYYYQIVTEEKETDKGLHKLFFDNTTEYPLTINAVHRFNIVSEIFTGLLYLSFMNLTEIYTVPGVTCWMDDGGGGDSLQCDGLGDPMFFYLSMLWILSGKQIFTIFMYGTFLSKHILGGFASVIYYFTLHEHATNLHTIPSARENFAYPFMLVQFFILSKEIAKRRSVSLDYQRNFTIISDMALVSTITIVFWQMASVIFALQILVVYFLYEINVLNRGLVNDYVVSQIFANVFAYILMSRSTFFLTSLHFAIALSAMLHLMKMQIYWTQPGMSTASRLRRFLRNLALLLFFTYIVIDILNKLFPEYLPYNITLSYAKLAMARLKGSTPSISAFLFGTMPDYTRLKYETAKQIFNVLCVKNICLFFIIFAGKYLQTRREEQYQAEQGDHIERAKNYVIEDYMEENRITMNDLSDPNTERAIQKCLDLLKECKYDYKEYKLRKQSHSLGESESEKMSFLSDIKKLKNQINEKEKKKQNEKEKQETEKSKEDNDEPGDDKNAPKRRKYLTKEKQTETTSESNDRDPADPVYIFNLTQLIALAVLQLFIEKVKYVVVPFACVFTATIPSKKWFLKNTHIYWMIYVTLMICTLVNPGFKNLQDQYQYRGSTDDTQEFIQLLKWIDTKTSKDAVFGGPIEVISAVQLVTRRKIVNHPHLEIPEMKSRTEAVYAIYSRRPANEVHNDLSAAKVDYLIVSHALCYNATSNGQRVVDYWDGLEPELKNDSQLCHEIFSNSFNGLLKVYQSPMYAVLRVYSENISDFGDLNLLPPRFKTH